MDQQNRNAKRSNPNKATTMRVKEKNNQSNK